MWRFIEGVISLVSGEWLLRSRPNGGAVILVRALLVATILFLVGLAAHERLTPGATWRLDPASLLLAIREHFTWLGALFAAAYTALYARFASQWTYLSGLYNQIMSTQAKAPKTKGDTPEEVERRRVYNNWMAGFIEDAENVHLALKPLYAALIKDMLGDPGIRDAFVAHTVGGAERLRRLEEKLETVVVRDEGEWQNAIKRDGTDVPNGPAERTGLQSPAELNESVE